MGVPCSALKKMRTVLAATTRTRMQGRSATLDMALACKSDTALDLVYAANTAPIVLWATAIWQARTSRDVLYTAMVGQLERVKAWCDVRGPAGVVAMTLRRIGWTAVTPKMVRIEVGQSVGLECVSPLKVKALVEESTRSALHAAVVKGLGQANESLAHGIAIGPLAKAIHKADSLPAEAARVRSTAVGAQWPMARKHECGLVDSPACLLCDDLGTPQPNVGG